MAEFTVELVGGPHAGRRALKSRRGRPPEEIPVRVAPAGGHEEQPEPGRFAIYRYSHRDEETDVFVYSYAHDRPAVTPRNRRPSGPGGGR